MKKLIIGVDSVGNLLDMQGAVLTVCNVTNMNYDLPVYDLPVYDKNKPNENDTDVVKLISLGVTPDDLIKLKASGLL